ncbi:MAG: DUF927 domain-containing protein, partial [Singulisphaera sp.]|nr:DUF927 domain-containing protein [Singulisphaera sp.]
KVSGFLECFEFDANGEVYQEFKAAAEALGLGDLIRRIEAGYLERSPSGGMHWLWRCPEGVDGNTVLAQYESDEVNEKTGKRKPKPLIETRGEGGYVILAPTNGNVHPSGGSYVLLAGGFRKIAVITAEEREALFNLARTFDRMPEPEPAAPAKGPGRPRKAAAADPKFPATVEPWDDYNARNAWTTVLPAEGWTCVYTRGDNQYWRRQGKTVGHSATVRTSTGRLFVFSSSTEFPAWQPLSPFDAYVIMRCGGDRKKAIEELKDQGYGEHVRWVPEDGSWHLRVFQNPCPEGERPAWPGSTPPRGRGRPKGRGPAANHGAYQDGSGASANGQAEHGPDAGLSDAGHEGPHDDHERGIHGYEERNGCLVKHDPRAAFGVLILSNFTARIVTQIERHEADEVRRLFEIKAKHQDGREAFAVVPAAKYNAMDWVAEQLGAEFTIFAGRSTRDDVRAALQLLSDRDGIARSVVHTSLGWIEHEGVPLYVHAKGCISHEGPSQAVKVETSSALASYFLPDPPTARDALFDALDAVFQLLTIGKTFDPASRQCAAVLMSLPWRAALAPFNSSIHFSGPSGTRKTSAARLALGFFATGAGARGGKVSVSWEATLNALQRYAFDCRDSLLLVDELTGDKAIAKAAEFFQSQGNLSARARMNKDKTLSPSLDPRGSVLSTGEADPLRKSALGRMLTVRFTKQTHADTDVLGRCQRDSAGGLHARATSAYIRWLADPGRLESMRARLRRRMWEIDAEIRKDPGAKDAHERQPEATAELIAASEIFLSFVVEVGYCDQEEADAYLRTIRAGLVDLLHSQADQNVNADPARRFIALLAAGLESRRFHLESIEGDAAPEPYAYALGWARQFMGHERGIDWTIPGGSIRLGYVDVEAGIAYVDPELAKSLAQTMGRDMGQPFEATGNIARDLHEAGFLKIRANEKGRNLRLTPTKKIRGAVKRYLGIFLEKLVETPEETDNETQDVPS